MRLACLIGTAETRSSTNARLILMVWSVVCHGVVSQTSTSDDDIPGDSAASPSAGRDWTKVRRDDAGQTYALFSARNYGTGTINKQEGAVQGEDPVRKRSLLDMFRQIYPGTKWCGSGNIAEHADDRGHFADTDSCCHQHDQCQLTLSGGEVRYGVRNPKSYTVSSCECDARFRACLQEVASFVSLQVGTVFFNIIQMPCLERNPSEGTLLIVPCKSYSQQTKKPTIGQVFSGEATFWSWLGGVFGGK